MKQTTIETKVANAILQKDVSELKIDGRTYFIAPPTIGTLIAVSDLVSRLPIVEKVPQKDVVNSVLRNARHFKALGEIASTLILGAKPIIEERTTEKKKRGILGLLGRKEKKTIKVNLQSELADLIVNNISPTVLFDVIVKRLKDMEIGTFFAITTSLSEANILKPTKEVENES